MDDIKVPYLLGPTTPSSHRSECTACRGDHCGLILSLAQILFFFVFGWDNEWILILNLVDVIIIKSLCTSSCIRPSHFLTNTVCPVPPLRLLPISNTPFGVASLSMLTVSVTIVVLFFYFFFLWDRVVGLIPYPPTANLENQGVTLCLLSTFRPLQHWLALPGVKDSSRHTCSCRGHWDMQTAPPW